MLDGIKAFVKGVINRKNIEFSPILQKFTLQK